MIQRLHREYLEREAAVHGKLHDIHRHLLAEQGTAHDAHNPGAPSAATGAAGNRQAPLGGAAP